MEGERGCGKGRKGYLSKGPRVPSYATGDAMLLWVLAVALCLCLSQVSVLLKGMDRLIWFLGLRLFTASRTLL